MVAKKRNFSLGFSVGLLFRKCDWHARVWDLSGVLMDDWPWIGVSVSGVDKRMKIVLKVCLMCVWKFSFFPNFDWGPELIINDWVPKARIYDNYIDPRPSKSSLANYKEINLRIKILEREREIQVITLPLIIWWTHWKRCYRHLSIWHLACQIRIYFPLEHYAYISGERSGCDVGLELITN